MVQDAPVSGVTLSVPFLARMAREIEQVKLFKIETPQAAAKIRALIEAGGDAIEGPFDGEEAITLMADLDAGATGSMTSATLPDLIGPAVAAYLDGRRDEAKAIYQRLLPIINFENRQCGWRSCKVVMKEGGVIRSGGGAAPDPAAAPRDPRAAPRARPRRGAAGAALGALRGSRGDPGSTGKALVLRGLADSCHAQSMHNPCTVRMPPDASPARGASPDAAGGSLRAGAGGSWGRVGGGDLRRGDGVGEGVGVEAVEEGAGDLGLGIHQEGDLLRGAGQDQVVRGVVGHPVPSQAPKSFSRADVITALSRALPPGGSSSTTLRTSTGSTGVQPVSAR